MTRLARFLPLRSAGTALLCTLALTLPASSAATFSFTFTTIDPPGSVETQVSGINKAGQIVGSYLDGTRWHGFLRKTDGTFTTIDPPGAEATQVSGINKAGQIIGDYVDRTGNHSFLRDTDGTFTTIDPPGAILAYAVGISGKRIVGSYRGSDNIPRGFLATK